MVSVGTDTHDIEAEIYFSVGENYHAVLDTHGHDDDEHIALIIGAHWANETRFGGVGESDLDILGSDVIESIAEVLTTEAYDHLLTFILARERLVC